MDRVPFFSIFEANFVMVEIVKDYLNKRLDLIKIETTEKTSVGLGHLVFLSLLFIFGSFFVLLLNIGIGLLIGYFLGNYGYGVLIISGFYLILLLLAFKFKTKITECVANKIIKFLND